MKLTHGSVLPPWLCRRWIRPASQHVQPILPASLLMTNILDTGSPSKNALVSWWPSSLGLLFKCASLLLPSYKGGEISFESSFEEAHEGEEYLSICRPHCCVLCRCFSNLTQFLLRSVEEEWMRSCKQARQNYIAFTFFCLCSSGNKVRFSIVLLL